MKISLTLFALSVISTSFLYDKLSLVQVVNVYDGDTITVSIDNVKEKIRFIGVDCPELKQQYGLIAKDFTKSELLNQYVKIDTDTSKRDKYNRILGYVYKDTSFINAELLKRGLCVTAFYKPNLKHYFYFKDLEKTARLNQLGIWNPSSPLLQSPSDFRHKKY